MIDLEIHIRPFRRDDEVIGHAADGSPIHYVPPTGGSSKHKSDAERAAEKATAKPVPELRLCPFCNGIAQLVVENVDGANAWRVECFRTSCGSVMHAIGADGGEETAERAARKWNRRPEASREPGTRNTEPRGDNARILFLSAECLRLKELLEKAERRISRLQFGNTVLMHTVCAAGDEMARRGEEIRAPQSDLQNSHASRTQLHDLLRAKDAEIAALKKDNAELMAAPQRSQRAD